MTRDPLPCKRRLLLFTSAVLSLLCVTPRAATAKDLDVDFAREILPILSNKCFVCHGPTAAEDQLRLDSYEAATADLGDYYAIHPTTPEESELLVRIHDPDNPMPPEEAEKQLTDSERALLDRWVRQGGKYAKHWAFVPPEKHPLPTAVDPGKSAAIDAFIAAALQQKGLDFAPVADRATLARRVALVLTGLPPEPKQLATYLADTSDQAYERLVDQLLDSPRYGEHQARYWLDAVRYGDTHGLHLDNRRGIYPYRDWVVRALNNNLPLDEFITWQLAGDLVSSPTMEQLIATGFVRMNPTTSEGGVIPAEFQAKNNFDRVETLGTVLLGMTLNCARCHTHKYDPIPQTEYYRLLAFFNSTAEPALDGNKYEFGPTLRVPADQAGWNRWQSLAEDRDSLLDEARGIVVESSGEELQVRWASAGPNDRVRMLADAQGPFADDGLRPRAAEIVKRIDEAEKGFTTTLIAQDLAEPRETHLLERGEYDKPTGEPLTPGILNVMGAFPADARRNRLGLAKWLTSREHPLVARVLVNRIWQRTFGEGLVRSPEDFGLQGQQPTHPELLDWLAVELQDSGWNLKHILRLMVTSRTFRQSSAWRRDVDDPENRWWARGPGFRLDAEIIRDMALWASGLLDPHMGGEGVKPYQPSGMWLAMAHPASNTKKYERDQGVRLYRRSLYVYWKRTSPHPMMTLFDAPDRESSCVRRSRTSTALQSLGLLNETQRIEMGRTFAERLLRACETDDERLDMMFGLLACREPNSRERNACTKLLNQMRDRYAGAQDDAVALLSQGDAQRDDSLDAAEHAAWTQVALVALASDLALLLY